MAVVQLLTFVRRRDQVDVSLPLLPPLNHLLCFAACLTRRGDTPIPLSVFEKWYANFLRKIENDRGAAFLDRTD